jgi:hypothetical protein
MGTTGRAHNRSVVPALASLTPVSPTVEGH